MESSLILSFDTMSEDHTVTNFQKSNLLNPFRKLYIDKSTCKTEKTAF